ncbi:hypothetical protein Scep_030744 [Stephania cephalantha]|uniref:Uncharacterized protein n=1 Tax=Stephania cephalantha TaxID=152367 RepID=A0AAP0E3E0_9MAGN
MNNNLDFDFDFGIGSNPSNRSRSLNDQKNKTPNSSFPQSNSKPTSSPSKWTQNKPAWTHQPSPNLSNPSSMVGDIFGKTWNSGAPMNSGIGIVDKNPNLFGDLVGSAFGQGRGSSNVPLKSAAPVAAPKSAFSMGNLGDSLPQTGAAMKGSNWGSSNFGRFSSSSGNVPNGGGGGGGSSGSLGGAGAGAAMRGGGSGGVKKDPFGSLVDFSAKNETAREKGSNVSGGMGNGKKSGGGGGDDSFGGFQNASKPSETSFSSSQAPGVSGNSGGTSSSFGSTKMDDFGNFEVPIGDFGSRAQAPSKANGVDPLDALFSSSASATAAPMGSSGAGSEPFSEMDDWNVGSEFGGNDIGGGGSTTELEGLPPPPSGVTASAAKNKGMDSHKQGQHADAIKWLSWAIVLLEKGGNNADDVLSCRASCYKEVGEYKKAIADCTKILADDSSNVSILVQRALLYESTEKYRLGAEDLRTVLKIDPGNRLARSTIHRLNKMAD